MAITWDDLEVWGLDPKHGNGTWNNRGGIYAVCPCPGHSDENEKLSLFKSEKQPGNGMTHCFEGCDWREISKHVEAGIAEIKAQDAGAAAPSAPATEQSDPASDLGDRTPVSHEQDDDDWIVTDRGGTDFLVAKVGHKEYACQCEEYQNQGSCPHLDYLKAVAERKRKARLAKQQVTQRKPPANIDSARAQSKAQVPSKKPAPKPPPRQQRPASADDDGDPPPMPTPEDGSLAAKLQERFCEEQWRELTKKGDMVAYVDARQVAAFLDKVVGVERWADSYRVLEHRRTEVEKDGRNGKYTAVEEEVIVECSLSLRTDDGWVGKTDTGYGERSPACTEPFKAAYSDAFKRAAVKWGVGRWLYSLPTRKKNQGARGRYDPTF